MKLKRWILAAGALVFAVVFTVRVVQVNRAYPPAKVTVIPAGETTTYAGDLEYTVSDAYFLPYDEMEALFNELDPEKKRYVYIPGEETELLIVEMTVHNPTETEQKVSVPYEVEADTWCNGRDSPMTSHLNPALESPLPAGETITLRLPFDLTYIQFAKANWKTATQRDFRLVLSLYPEKVVMELPLHDA